MAMIRAPSRKHALIMDLTTRRTHNGNHASGFKMSANVLILANRMLIVNLLVINRRRNARVILFHGTAIMISSNLVGLIIRGTINLFSECFNHEVSHVKIGLMIAHLYVVNVRHRKTIGLLFSTTIIIRDNTYVS